MVLYDITAGSLSKVTETSFDKAGVCERADLQRLLKKQIEVIAPDTLVIKPFSEGFRILLTQITAVNK